MLGGGGFLFSWCVCLLVFGIFVSRFQSLLVSKCFSFLVSWFLDFKVSWFQNSLGFLVSKFQSLKVPMIQNPISFCWKNIYPILQNSHSMVSGRC